MSTLDPFGKTDKLDEETLKILAIRFEARGQHALFARMLHEYVDVMQMDGADAVLDLGCGTGLAARMIARRPDFHGQVTGIDLSPFLVMAAERLAEAEGLSEQTRFHTGDVHKLEFEDASFDAAVAHTLLSHVQNPVTVIEEAARVLKPGGRLGVFDGDYASLTFGQPDPGQAKEYDELLINAVVTNPHVMRQMTRILKDAGFEILGTFPNVMAEAGRANFWASAIEAYRRLLPQTGEMTAEQADAWAAALYKDSEMGVFFGSCNYYAYVATRK